MTLDIQPTALLSLDEEDDEGSFSRAAALSILAARPKLPRYPRASESGVWRLRYRRLHSILCRPGLATAVTHSGNPQLGTPPSVSRAAYSAGGPGHSILRLSTTIVYVIAYAELVCGTRTMSDSGASSQIHDPPGVVRVSVLSEARLYRG